MAVTSAEISTRVEGQTIPRLLLRTAANRPQASALRWRAGDEFHTLSYVEFVERAGRVAAGLGALGVGPGTRVVLFLRNRPEFHIADVGALLCGATPVSIYNSSSPEQVRSLVRHCAAEVAIVDNPEFLDRVLVVRDDLPALREIVLVDGSSDAPAVRPWSWLVGHDSVDLETAAGIARPHDLATVIYTSGTTGEPKGVMLDHTNVAWTVESLRSTLSYSTEGFRMISYLPAAHIAERMTSHYGGLVQGYEITTCPDIRLVGSYLTETRPQVLFGTPRTFEKIHSGVRALLALDPLREEAFDRVLARGAEAARARADGQELDAITAARVESAETEMLAPVRALLGLDAVECAVSAAAPLSVEILEFVRALGVPLAELYGLSETSGPASWDPERVRPGTVGRALPGEEIRTAEDGEVLIRGGNVFRGYLDDPELTAAVLDSDGWLHTGDVGTIDEDGYLRIVDRKKELIITATGKNVSPASLEAALKAQPLIGQACAIGDKEPYVAALLVLDSDVAPVWAAQHEISAVSLAELAEDPQVLAEVEREVEAVNRHFSHAEQIRRFTVLSQEWLPDSEELTPTMKVKRRAVEAKYAAEIAALYAR